GHSPSICSNPFGELLIRRFHFQDLKYGWSFTDQTGPTAPTGNTILKDMMPSCPEFKRLTPIQTPLPIL
ncbi:hypothetical protein AVEN_172519-1, partial [Araneus ventricosus]